LGRGKQPPSIIVGEPPTRNQSDHDVLPMRPAPKASGNYYDISKCGAKPTAHDCPSREVPFCKAAMLEGARLATAPYQMLVGAATWLACETRMHHCALRCCSAIGLK